MLPFKLYKLCSCPWDASRGVLNGSVIIYMMRDVSGYFFLVVIEEELRTKKNLTYF